MSLIFLLRLDSFKSVIRVSDKLHTPLQFYVRRVYQTPLTLGRTNEKYTFYSVTRRFWPRRE
ncbi:Uncharacterised protein [Yersinia similis]|uniref:Uncharacterized protein n=1 Tax=Yersinia similis TaxID=367190 RepID=A0A0T9PI40_9GAMM|nr:Uncharacterised protein [Yersinia similis]CNB53532.1 Uncharacterised protein [Yersinia similis]CNE45978.1 Uncharacterised protein [Yersinia similis]CNE96828.1 Uncharacterised protein [Yersinia similis]CNH66302.1 Uncharacterised protein [Yersinia similis]